MTESEFLGLAEKTLCQIEQKVEALADNETLDVECTRSGNVLEIEVINNGSKIIINSQAPMQQIWMAAKSGGFHYQHNGQAWVDTRSGVELFDALVQLLGLAGKAQLK